VRRDELARLGVQLPVLPVIVLGGLPGDPDWASRLERIGLDVVSSGAYPDTVATWRAACDAVPHRPVKAVAGDAHALVVAGCVIVEGGEDTVGGYRVDAGDGVILGIDGASEATGDPDGVAARIVAAMDALAPAAAWVAATGLSGVAIADAEARLAALVEGTRRARLYLAKHQFDL
jgi:hypothetical protein